MESPIWKKIVHYGLYVVFMLVFAWVSGQLFFERQTDNLMTSVGVLFAVDEQIERIDNLRVVFPDEPVSLEPTLADAITRQRLVNIYEPLVRPDRDLKMRPALALSWGLIDDLTWDFRLRPGVTFHDGTKFDVNDAVGSFERAISNKGSEIAGLLTSIDKVEAINEMTLRVKTLKPDPLLLQRLSTVLIMPSEQKDKKIVEPIGTGSYLLSSFTPGEGFLIERFDDYWGKKSQFETVEMIAKTNKSERVNMFLRGDADLLSFVAYDAVPIVKERGFEISGIPSLEVQFLMFNHNSEIFKNVKNKKVVSLAIDQNSLLKSFGEYAKSANQFISNGIFGFSPDISQHKYDLKAAGNLAKETGLKGKTITFHLQKGLDLLGEHVRTQLSEIGVNVIVSYLEPDRLFQSMVDGTGDIYFLGFKSDLGDGADFLDVMVDTDGAFNVANYSNDSVDKLISEGLTEMDPTKRLADLQKAMKIIVEDDVVGVPLFEYETVYSFVDALEFEPRIDGLIYFDEINIK